MNLMASFTIAGSAVSFAVAMSCDVGAGRGGSRRGVWVRLARGKRHGFDFYNCADKLCAKVVAVAKPRGQQSRSAR